MESLDNKGINGLLKKDGEMAENDFVPSVFTMKSEGHVPMPQPYFQGRSMKN